MNFFQNIVVDAPIDDDPDYVKPTLDIGDDDDDDGDEVDQDCKDDDHDEDHYDDHDDDVDRAS